MESILGFNKKSYSTNTKNTCVHSLNTYYILYHVFDNSVIIFFSHLFETNMKVNIQSNFVVSNKTGLFKNFEIYKYSWY